MLLLLGISLARAAEPAPALIRDCGEFLTEKGNAKLVIARTADKRVAVGLHHASGGRSGHGDLSPTVVREGQWACAFEGEQKAWFYDGLGTVRLVEITETGFKFSDSAVVPDLKSSMPAPLRELIATHGGKESARWGEIKDLAGEALVIALIELGDTELAELKERQKNLRLELTALEVESKTKPEIAGEYSVRKALEAHLTRKLHERALERKLAIWDETDVEVVDERAPRDYVKDALKAGVSGLSEMVREKRAPVGYHSSYRYCSIGATLEDEKARFLTLLRSLLEEDGWALEQFGSGSNPPVQFSLRGIKGAKKIRIFGSLWFEDPKRACVTYVALEEERE